MYWDRQFYLNKPYFKNCDFSKLLHSIILKKDTTLKRRDFIKKSITTISSLSLLGSTTGCDSDDSLPFKGKVVGGNFNPGHLFRDGKLIVKNAKTIDEMKSCVIIGGGASGVGAGWKLYEEGTKDFVILEKDAQLGGTAQAGQGNGTEFPWGAHYVETPPKEAKFLYPLYEDLGIIMGYMDDGWPIINSEFIVKDPEVYLYAKNKWIDGRFPLAIAAKKDRESYFRFLKKMDFYYYSKGRDGKTLFTIPIDETSKDPQYLGLDKITMRSYLRREGFDSPLLDWYVDMQCRDNFGTAYHEISAWVAVNYFATNFNDLNSADSKRHPVNDITWAEGNQYLIKGMSRKFTKDNLKLNAFCIDVKNEKDHVKVTYYDIKEQRFFILKAKTAIFALPKFLLTRLCKEAEYRKPYLKDFHYAPWLVANLHLKHPPLGKPLSWDNIYYQPLNSKKNWSLGYILANYQDKRIRFKKKEPTVLTFYAPLIKGDAHSERKNLLSQGWDYWANRIVDDLSIMHPNIKGLIERCDIYKWGHAMIQPKANFVWGQSRALVKKPIGKIFMAHCDVGGIPIFEQAFYSGLESSQKVLKLLE